MFKTVVLILFGLSSLLLGAVLIKLSTPSDICKPITYDELKQETLVVKGESLVMGQQTTLLGDVNLDGKINMVDVSLVIANHIRLVQADVNQNGIPWEIEDAQKIVDIYYKSEDTTSSDRER